MRRLVLMRHAKSSWAEGGLADHERPLNQRGRLAAALMGAWLAEQPWRLDAAIVSTSVRTRRTWDLLRLDAPTPVYEPRIYEAEPTALLGVLRAAPEGAETVMMLGHNPGLEELSAMISAEGGPYPGRFATGAVAVFEMTAPWRELGHGRARLTEFEAPKSLV